MTYDIMTYDVMKYSFMTHDVMTYDIMTLLQVMMKWRALIMECELFSLLKN